MKIICIVGKKRTGKTTISEIIVNQHEGYQYPLAYPLKKVLSDVYNKFDFQQHSMVELNMHNFDGLQDYDRDKPINLSTKNIIAYMTQCVYMLIDDYGLKQENSAYFMKNAEIEKTITEIVKSKTWQWSVRRFMQTLGTDIVVNVFDKMFWCKLMMVELAKISASKMEYEYFIVPDIRQDHEFKLMRDLNATILFVEKPSINNGTNDLHITERGILPLPHDIVITNDGTIEDLKLKTLKVLQND